MSASRTSAATRRPSANDDVPADPIDAILHALREEWRDGFTARVHVTMALGRLEGLRRRAPSQQTVEELRALEARLRAYRDLPPDRRRDELPRIAEALKAIAPTLRQLAEPAPPVGTLDAALRRPKSGKRTTPAAASPAPAAPTPPALRLTDPVTKLPKVGPAVAKKLANLGVATVGDLVELKPRRYVDYSKTLQISRIFDVQPGDDVTVRGEVIDIQEIQGRGKPRTEARIADRSGSIRVVWFSPYVAHQVHPGDQIALHGQPDFGYGRISFTSPEWEKIADGGAIAEGRIAPVYPLTEGIGQKFLRGLTRQAVDGALSQVEDWLPESVRTRLGAGEDGALPTLREALAHVHFPDHQGELERSQRRLAFDDLFLLQIGLVRMKRRRQAFGGIPMPADPALLRRFRASLPFRLTGAQDSALDEILADLAGARPMSRLLQGDVGSGKTVVAAAAMLVAHANDRQAAMMAPTEILAEQHFHNLRGLYHTLPEADRPRVALLTGSTRAAERRETLAAVEAGEIDILVGTHALIQESVAFAALGLSVVDEQHRFGVRQRSTLPDKASGALPHQLAMTATPIPRTLNMVLNGDLDVSIVAERPPGRLPIATRRYFGDERDEAYALVREQVAAGRQVFVICPLVEASEATEAKAAVDEAARLQRDVLPDLRIGTLHGRMSGRDKDRIMTAFRDREYHILVSTSVIEVGVDVPNATVMLVEGADRFGLAQLHQFRGRVGRGGAQSWCLLLADEATPDGEARLEMVEATDDGFALAEKDLELRGPGDFIGTRQSGLPEMSWLDGSFDPRVLDRARRAAEAILTRDPELALPEHRALAARVAAFWEKASPDIPMF